MDTQDSLKLPSLMGHLIGSISVAIFLWVGYFCGYEILDFTYLLKAAAVWFVTVLTGYAWGIFFMSTFYKEVEKRLFEELDEIIIEAPDVSDFDLVRLTNRSESNNDDQEESQDKLEL